MGPAFLDWVDDPDDDEGFWFATHRGWDRHSFAEFADGAWRAAGLLSDLGLRRNDVVSIVLPLGPGFLHAFVGTLLAGGVPSPVALPATFPDRDRYIGHVGAVLMTAGTAIAIVDDDLTAPIATAAAPHGLKSPVVAASAIAAASPRTRAARRADLALLQFTSGSAGAAKAVELSWSNLDAAVNAISRWLRWSSEDVGATWLPVHHDMGLVGCVLTSLARGSRLLAMTPEQFIRNPYRWLECFGRLGATLTATPSFALGYAARRATASRLADFDFRHWRVAVVGGERVDASAMASFTRLLAPFGFNPSTLTPAYGLAEATLTVTGSSPVEEPLLLRLGPVRYDAAVTVRERSRLSGLEVANHEGWIAGCGSAVGDLRVSIVGADGEAVGAGYVGEIFVRGPSVATRYRGAPEATSTTLDDGTVATGDAGFVDQGQLFVLGRLGDGINIRGQLILAENLEVRLASVLHLSARHHAVLLGVRDGCETAVLVIEAPRHSEWLPAAVRTLRSETAPRVSVRVISGPSGTVLRTSSGKPRRREMWRLYCEDRLGGEEVTKNYGSEV